ncbi:MAG: hypothetical protein N2689_15000 [Verrucomicrobiae bacterium]|nr:hypothetical protein [Verrucomicrobiae bacterium]
MKTMCTVAAVLGVAIALAGCARTVQTETRTTTTIIRQEPVVATDQEIGKKP